MGKSVNRVKRAAQTSRLDIKSAPCPKCAHRLRYRRQPRVRAQTGFAISGVAPIGHLYAMPTFMDDALMAYATVWGAGGAPETVFEITPRALLRAADTTLFSSR